MQHNSNPNFRSEDAILVDQLVQSTVESYQPQFTKSSINVELDLENVEAAIDREMVRETTKLLLDNATEKMLAGGGTISVTLIDGEHQWELEVADTDGMAYHPFGHSNDDSAAINQPKANENEDLPVILQFPSTESLRQAYRLAAQHGGQIQTWDCPQGGTAHVLVVPKRPNRNSFSV